MVSHAGLFEGLYSSDTYSCACGCVERSGLVSVFYSFPFYTLIYKINDLNEPNFSCFTGGKMFVCVGEPAGVKGDKELSP